MGPVDEDNTFLEGTGCMPTIPSWRRSHSGKQRKTERPIRRKSQARRPQGRKSHLLRIAALPGKAGTTTVQAPGYTCPERMQHNALTIHPSSNQTHKEPAARDPNKLSLGGTEGTGLPHSNSHSIPLGMMCKPKNSREKRFPASTWLGLRRSRNACQQGKKHTR